MSAGVDEKNDVGKRAGYKSGGFRGGKVGALAHGIGLGIKTKSRTAHTADHLFLPQNNAGSLERQDKWFIRIQFSVIPYTFS